MTRTTLLATLLVSGTAWADTTVHVLDARTGAPLAEVTLTLPGGGTAHTGTDGAFVLPDQAGPLTASLEGYTPARLKVDPAAPPSELRLTPLHYASEEIVISTSRYGGDLHLSQTSISREEIEERHTTEDIPQLLEDTPGLFASSDSGNGMGYDYLTLRGFDQRRVGVMVNGIPMNDPEDHQVYWVDMPDLAMSLEDAQIQRGVTNSLGGATAVGGTINLVTNVHTVEPGGEMAFYLGSYNTSREALAMRSGLRKGWFSTALRLSHMQTDGYRDRAGSEQSAVFWSAQALTPATTTTVNIYTGHEVTQQAWYGISDAQLAEDRRQNPVAWADAVDDFRQPHYELHNQWNIKDGLTLENSAWWVHGEGFYDTFKEDRTARDYGLDLAFDMDPDAELNLVRRKWVAKDQVGWVPRLNIDYARGRTVIGGSGWIFHSRHWGEVIAADGLTPTDLGSALKYHEWTGDKWSASGFINQQLELFDGFTLLADLHYQHISYSAEQAEVAHFTGEDRHQWSGEYDFFNPKGGAHWTVGDLGDGALSLFGHVGVAHHEPADSDLFDTWQGPDDLGTQPLFEDHANVEKDGAITEVRWTNPVVQPEKVVDYEAGLSWRSATVSVALNGYWMDFTNEIVPYGGLNADGFAVKGNAASTLHRGIEAEVGARIADVHKLHLAASKSWDEYRDFTVYEDQWDWDTWEYLGTEQVDLSGNPIAGFPDHLVSARWTSQLGPATPGLRFRSVGRQYLDNTGDVDRSIDPWMTLDLSLALDLGGLGVRAWEGATADLRVNNVLNEQYESYGYYDGWGEGRYRVPAAERNVMAGVRYVF